MEEFFQVVSWILMLTGIGVWVFGFFMVWFYWSCQRPPKDEQ
jgi:hypothetical protein